MKDWVIQVVATIVAGVVVWYLNEYQSQPLKNVENLNFTAPVTPSFNLKSDELAALVRAEEARLKEIQSQRMAEELRITILQRQQQLEQQRQVEQARLLELQQQREAEEARLEALQQQQQSQVFEPEMVDIPAGELISGRYRDNGDGTVTDVTTNLMWKRCSEGQTWTGSTCAGEAITMTWNEAMPNAQQKSWPAFAGRNDWRVPTVEELKTLVYCSSGKPKTWNNIIDAKKYDSCAGEYQRPTIDQIAFPNTPEKWFWSASPNAYSTDDAWVVSFYDGYDGYGSRTYAGRARLVCAGQ